MTHGPSPLLLDIQLATARARLKIARGGRAGEPFARLRLHRPFVEALIAELTALAAERGVYAQDQVRLEHA